VPQQQLAGGVEVERSADRPGLDERPLLPDRLPNVGLRHSVDPRTELQLGRRLQLGLDAAHRAHDLDESLAAGPVAQERPRQPARSHLIPSDAHVG